MSPWDSENVMYGTGATIRASNDILSSVATNSAPEWNVQAQGIEETVAFAMMSPTKGPQLFAGFGDINGIRFHDLDVPQPMFGLPVFSKLNGLDWAGQNQSTVVRVGVNGLNSMAEIGCHQGAYATDGDVAWSTFGCCILGVNSTTSDSGTIAIDSSRTHIVWSSTSTSLEGNNPATNFSGPYYWCDLGTTWYSPNGLAVQTPNISADRVESGTFFSLTEGSWYVCRDGGATHSSQRAADVGLPDDAALGALPVVDFAKAGHVYLPLGSQGIFYTSNFGNRFAKLTAAGVNPSLFTVGAPAPHSPYPAPYLWGTVTEG